jgi:hypothetical protein
VLNRPIAAAASQIRFIWAVLSVCLCLVASLTNLVEVHEPITAVTYDPPMTMTAGMAHKRKTSIWISPSRGSPI